jgi:LmbE family N-acetylglucosaminyl deacetylase
MREAREAASILGGENVKLKAFAAPDGQLGDRIDAASAWLTALLARTKTENAFVTWDADPHRDHQAAHRILRQAITGSAVAAWSYPVWGLTLAAEAIAGEPAACVNLDIRGVIDRKHRAIDAHRTQVSGLIRDCPDGFRLSAADIGRHTGPLESYLRVQ